MRNDLHACRIHIFTPSTQFVKQGDSIWLTCYSPVKRKNYGEVRSTGEANDLEKKFSHGKLHVYDSQLIPSRKNANFCHFNYCNQCRKCLRKLLWTLVSRVDPNL